VVQQLFLFVAGGGNELPSGLFAKSCPTPDATTVVNELRRILRPAVESARQGQIPQQRAIDFLSHVEFHADGGAADGWRVTANDGTLKNVTWYVVLEDGTPKLAEDRLRSTDESVQASRSSNVSESQAVEAMRMGDFASAGKQFRELCAQSKIAPSVHNMAAWNAIFESTVNKEALDDALAAVEQSKSANYAFLNTLAAVYAEQGDAAKALENLRTSVALHGEKIHESDWYVLGRIAENYRLKSEAIRLYDKISAPPHPVADDVFALAQRRLKKLQEK
jgi:tetratricopeptide (TPR) repeat protein